MRILRLPLCMGLALFALNACNFPPALFASSTPVMQPTPIVFPKIDRHPSAASWHRAFLSMPSYDPTSEDPYQVDLRSADLSALDLRGSLNDLLYSDFDTQTQWPPEEQMPSGFDWKRIMELGKNPGLSIRSLQARGITGRGVNIAIIDQPLLIEHQEYADRFQLYEEINVTSYISSQMHGPAVASIAVGKTVGVAPEANLYYIATWVFDPPYNPANPKRDFRFYAQAIRHLLEINRQLPQDQKIRAISMSVGWSPAETGYEEITAAANDAKAAGMLVVSSSIEQTHGFKINGLGRPPLADPDQFESYEPGLFWAKRYDQQSMDRLLIPMDSRTTASFTGASDYVFFRPGGWSWITPYLAGVYALAVQVDPSITPERFWSLAMKTGHTIQFKRGNENVPLGPILDPVALINALEHR